jgi:Zinc-binding dehydrogenase
MGAERREPMVDRILPLLEVRRAHELSQTGHTRGKIVLRPSWRKENHHDYDVDLMGADHLSVLHESGIA